MAKRPDHFTLIELLVVIAIISILASMLIPALKKARESAQNIECVSNLKQYAIACHEYISDNDGWFPTSYDNVSVELPGFGVSEGDTWQWALGGYTQKLLCCPSRGVYDTDFATNHLNFGMGGYGWNTRAFGYKPNYVTNSNYGSPRKVTTVRKPAQKMCAADRTFYSYCYYILANPSDINQGVYGRHSGRVNIMCADGHIASEKQADIYTRLSSSPKNYYWNWDRDGDLP
jgi:prepilin-type N-terminal cleavage/methylation domain-containing protein/prepilin-type processing-associated H-X9-DG protein